MKDSKLEEMLSEARKFADRGSVKAALQHLKEAMPYSQKVGITIDNEVREIKNTAYRKGIYKSLSNAEFYYSIKSIATAENHIKMAKEYAKVMGLDISDRIQAVQKTFNKT